ncbi:MAG: Na+ dependent nucleoside transporter, partial [Flavobacteriales bacterium]|nr:Na+ dependent nucleoside transporter [Flavobacteriales bacterium]
MHSPTPLKRSARRAALLLPLLLPMPALAQSTPAPLTGLSVESLFRGLLGMACIIAIAWVFSAKRKHVDWKVVGIGLLFQLVLALAILYVPFVQTGFELVGRLFVKVLDFTRIGSEFLFRDLMDVKSSGFIFALQILPTIIFFSA